MSNRITRGRFDSSRYDDLLPLAHQVDAAVQSQPGNHSCQTAIDRTGGRTLAVSTSDTAEHASLSRDMAPMLSDVVRHRRADGAPGRR